MRRINKSALAWVVSWLAVTGLGAQQEEADPQAQATVTNPDRPTMTGPVVLRRPDLQRPDVPREAMVYVRFLVSAEGKPTEIEVVQDRGFHTEPFRRVALRYVRDMRFKPATRDGVPVVYGPLTQPIRFGLGLSREQQGVTPEFRRELDKVAKFMKEGDFAGAHFHAEWMLREKVVLGYEFAVLQAQLAQTLASVERFDEALAAAWAATSRTSVESAGFRIGEPPPRNDASAYLLPRDLIVYLLGLRMRLLARQGDVLSALKTYNELAGLQEPKAGDPLIELSDQLRALLQSGKALVFAGEVKANREFWPHELYHSRFTTRNVQGRLGTVHLHCRGQFATYEYEAGKVWTVPPGWESCLVEFYGEPGAKLELVELPTA